MSSSSLIREPAWSGLAPGLPERIVLPRGVSCGVLAELRMEGQLTGLRFGSGPVSQYLLERPSQAPVFLKIVAPERREAAERAEAIGRWLAGKDLSVVAPLEGFPRMLPDGRLAIATAFLDGRRLRSAAGELELLGKAAGRLHSVLARHPDRSAWAAATAQRMDALSSVRNDLASGRLRCGSSPDELSALAADPALDFLLPPVATTPLHGDLNPGNVLFDLQSHKVVLLDFEDVFHSVLPPIFEIMTMLERFVLVPVAEAQEAFLLSQALLAGYRSECGVRLDCGSRRPSDVLRSLSLRSLCVLALGHREGVMIAAEEWRKFIDLEQAARRRAALVDRMITDGSS